MKFDRQGDEASKSLIKIWWLVNKNKLQAGEDTAAAAALKTVTKANLCIIAFASEGTLFSQQIKMRHEWRHDEFTYIAIKTV